MATNYSDLPHTNSAQQILDDLLGPLGQCMTPEMAQRVVDLLADGKVQARLELLAEKNTEGDLTSEEEEEYRAAVQAVDFIGILQAKARTLLNS